MKADSNLIIPLLIIFYFLILKYFLFNFQINELIHFNLKSLKPACNFFNLFFHIFVNIIYIFNF